MKSESLLTIILALSFLYACIFLDFWYTKHIQKKKKTLSFILKNIKFSMGQQVINALIQIGLFAIYVKLYNSFALFNLPATALTFILAFIVLDHNTYWFHRFSHHNNFLWSNHMIHHSGDEFGLSVSIRNPWYASFLLAFPQLVLAFIGVPPEMFVTVVTVFYLFQFFSHLDSVGKLGVLEKIFITPSHHRAHHASNAIYIDKNFGSVFVVWDKLFGTFQEETETAQFGLTHPNTIENTFWENTYTYYLNVAAVFKLNGLKEKIRFLFLSPGEVESYMSQNNLNYLYEKSQKIDHFIRRFELQLNSIAFIAAFSLALIITVLFRAYYLEISTTAQFLSAFAVIIICTLLPDRPLARPPFRGTARSFNKHAFVRKYP